MDARIPRRLRRGSFIYVIVVVDFFGEVKQYSDTWDEQYYERWYGKWAEDLGDDPYGIISFVLVKYENCTNENCALADALGLNIDDLDEGYRKFVGSARKYADEIVNSRG